MAGPKVERRFDKRTRSAGLQGTGSVYLIRRSTERHNNTRCTYPGHMQCWVASSVAHGSDESDIWVEKFRSPARASTRCTGGERVSTLEKGLVCRGEALCWLLAAASPLWQAF